MLNFKYIGQGGNVAEDSGYIHCQYANGQFIVSDHPFEVKNPCRFEWAAILEVW